MHEELNTLTSKKLWTSSTEHMYTLSDGTRQSIRVSGRILHWVSEKMQAMMTLTHLALIPPLDRSGLWVCDAAYHDGDAADKRRQFGKEGKTHVETRRKNTRWDQTKPRRKTRGRRIKKHEHKRNE